MKCKNEGRIVDILKTPILRNRTIASNGCTVSLLG
jgi:hypothetical protein